MLKTILRAALLMGVIATPIVAQAELTETRTIQPAPHVQRHHHHHHHHHHYYHKHHHHHHHHAMAKPDAVK